MTEQEALDLMINSLEKQNSKGSYMTTIIPGCVYIEDTESLNKDAVFVKVLHVGNGKVSCIRTKEFGFEHLSPTLYDEIDFIGRFHLIS